MGLCCRKEALRRCGWGAGLEERWVQRRGASCSHSLERSIWDVRGNYYDLRQLEGHRSPPTSICQGWRAKQGLNECNDDISGEYCIAVTISEAPNPLFFHKIWNNRIEHNNFNLLAHSFQIGTMINSTLIAHLATNIPNRTLMAWAHRLQQEQPSSCGRQPEIKEQMTTPATSCSRNSKNNSAIERGRPKMRPKRESPSKEGKPNTEGRSLHNEEKKEETSEQRSCEEVTKRVAIPFKAVSYGQDSEVPYLQASQALETPYSAEQRKSQFASAAAVPILLNPPASSPHLSNLKSLHIYYQPSLESLRQLGTGWSHLVELSILYSSLADLSGLSSFSSLECLFLGYNCVETLSELMFHPRLRCLDLEGNMVRDIQELEYLSTIELLEWVELEGNPVMEGQGRQQVADKIGAKLHLEDRTVGQYQLQCLQQEHELMGYQDIEVSNALVKRCNDLLRGDEITVDQMHRSFLRGRKEQLELQVVRYEGRSAGYGTQEASPIEEQEMIFTPLLHFSNRQEYSAILLRYLENKLYLTLKRQQKQNERPLQPSPQQKDRPLKQTDCGREGNSNLKTKSTKNNDDLSTMQAPLRPVSRLTRLFRERETLSGEKGELGSLEVKKSRLSLGRPKLLLEKANFRGGKTLLPSQAFASSTMSTMLSTGSSSISPMQGLKRTSLMRRVNPGEVQSQIQRRFARTGPVAVDCK